MNDSIFSRGGEVAFRPPESVLVAGATGGIGKALTEAVSKQYPSATLIRLARDPSILIKLKNETIDLPFDLTKESSLSKAIDQIPKTSSIDLALIATGWLYDERQMPEKTYKSLAAEHLLYAYQMNAIGPALLCVISDLSYIPDRAKCILPCVVPVKHHHVDIG
jgi:short-subunit dehydrogenase